MAPLFPFVLIVSVFVTAVISGTVGMAGGMILMGLLAWILPVREAMLMHATAQFFSNISRAVLHRAHIHRASVGFYLMGLAVSFALFCAIAFVPDKAALFLLLGAGPFLPLILPAHARLDFTRPLHAFLCGLFVSAMHLTAGVSGPLLDMFFQQTKLTRHQNVATKALTQSISHLTKFAYFGFVVPSALDVSAHLPLWLYLAVIPVAVAGNHAGKWFLDRLTDVQFYRVTQWILWAAGLVYLFRGAQLLWEG